MSRVDVVKGDKKGKFIVLINMGMDGSYTYSSIAIANKEAENIHGKMHKATLTLFIIKKK